MHTATVGTSGLMANKDIRPEPKGLGRPLRSAVQGARLNAPEAHHPSGMAFLIWAKTAFAGLWQILDKYQTHSWTRLLTS